jgi:tetratricopeptide (TPR) repeat protein
MFSLMNKSGRRLRAVTVAVLALAALAPGVNRAARAEPPAPAAAASAASEVERHAEIGKRHFDHGRFQDAIAEYREAYELRASPIFLHEIADAYRQLGIVDRALFFYDRYLETRPDAPDRGEVEGIISELEQSRRRAAAVPNRAALRLSAPAGEVSALGIAATPARAVPVPATRTPIWRRWWFWGAAAALVAAGVTTALLASSGQNDANPPATDLGTKRFF